MDNKTTIEYLKNIVKEFCEERNWDQFHNPKDLAIGISTESNELLDIFRFKTDKQMIEMLQDINKKKQISDELSDVLYFVLRFAQLYDIDLATSLDSKMKINKQKYTIGFAKNNNKKFGED